MEPLSCKMSRQSNIDNILKEAYALYADNSHCTTLGRCIRQVCSQMRVKEHNILAKLNGNVAEDYLKEHFEMNKEEQINLEGL